MEQKERVCSKLWKKRRNAYICETQKIHTLVEDQAFLGLDIEKGTQPK